MTPNTADVLSYSGVSSLVREPATDGVAEAMRELTRLSHDPQGWFRLPWMDAAPIREALASLPGGCDTLLVLGIGGSSLGLRALHDALAPTLGPGDRRLVILETFEADRMLRILQDLDPQRTAVHVVTKSGQTLETIANFLLVEHWLSEGVHAGQGAQDGASVAARVLVTTDPGDTPLSRHARAQGYRLLPLPAAVGGRYSVLSAVGLVGLSWMGVDLDALLLGAREAAESSLVPTESGNPALALAVDQVALCRAGFTQTVFMPYGGQLEGLARWFVQLWAESLGKSKAVGPTPLAAVGTQDQHAQLQLIVEGPAVRNLLFVEAASSLETLRVPRVPESLASLGFLGGHSLHELRAASLEGVRRSLTSVNVPHATLRLDRFDARGMGALVFTVEVATALAGFLFGVNPFDQPGVEDAKQRTRALLSDAGPAATLESSS